MNHASSVLGALYRRKFVILAVFLGAVGAGAFYANRTPTEYVAIARVLIPASPVGISLRSESGNLPSSPIIPDSSEDMRVGVMGIISSGEVHARMAQKDPSLDAKRVRKNLVGNIGRDSYMNLVAYGPTAQEATDLANIFAESFEEVMQEHTEIGPRSSLATFQRVEPVAWETYHKESEKLTTFLGSIGSTDLERDYAQWSSRRVDVQAKLVELELSHAQRVAERPVLEALVAARPEFRLTRQQMGRNSAYSSALERVRDKSTEVAVALLKYKEKNPELIRLRKELELAEQQAQGEAELVQSSMTSELDAEAKSLMGRLTQVQIEEASVDAQRDLLTAEATVLDGKLATVPANRGQLDALTSDIASAREFATEVSNRRAELEFHLEHGIRFTISGADTRAKLEDTKALPTVAGIYLFSIFAGILIGILLAILLELLSIMRSQKPF